MVFLVTDEPRNISCGTVEDISNAKSFVISCPNNITATQLILYDDTASEADLSGGSNVVMSVIEVTVQGAPIIIPGNYINQDSSLWPHKILVTPITPSLSPSLPLQSSIIQ